MKLHEIFEKPVDRPIEGVIKADDEASLRLEIEEYVVTNEVAKRLESFLDAYNNYEGANGVWISGFFGSGKSHLLKMLALSVENRDIDGVSVLDLFLEKPEIKGNEILRGDLKKAVSIPSKSILFNIDQKADVISKTEIDALLSVFVKVFDEMCGYFGKQGHIAQFERELDEEGIFQEFQDTFKKASGQNWDFGRRRPQRFAKSIDQAYGDTTKQSVSGIVDKYKADYKVSIEDFAEQINDYIERQAKDFRLNFFVDEVGQYVADNVKLMTNLQTIAESLATKCRGRAWVIVTAQEEMTEVVGEMTAKQGNDFSKIMARFSNRMKLTSANVDEVIQKRLLLKKEEGVTLLSDVYHEQSNNFKTLFDFADGSKIYKNFRDRDHFIHCYPFIPYQFTLFQTAIQSLSSHNAFEGKHSSVGERSMLGVFQQVAVNIAEHEVGQLATFDLMFEGLRTSIKAQIQRAILTSEKHLDSPFAIRVLKALFLVKYVKDYKATVRNLCVLMIDRFDQDLPTLRKQVEEALNLLEQQTYVQRNGEEYEFLTDEEKDVEQEIKNTEVETADVAAELSKVIFDHILKTRKIRFDENNQDYSFSRKLDDQLHGRDHELSIHVISPFHENAGKEELLRMQSMGRDELLVVMASDERLVRDLLMYKRAEKYIRQNTSVTQQETVQHILAGKGLQNRERYNDLQQRISGHLGKAKLLLNGEEIELSGEEPIAKVTRGFYRLIQFAYPNLRMLRGVTYSESDIATYLGQAEEGLFGSDAATISEAEQEMLAFIQNNSRGGVRTTLKSIVERFECKPYGWYLAAIQCTLAKLCVRGKVEVRSDSNILEDSALARALKNTHGFSNVVLEPQVDFTASQVRKLKEFYADFFDGPPATGEAKALGKETADALLQLSHDLAVLAGQSAQYPFLEALTEPVQRLKEASGKHYTFYLTELAKIEDSLLDLKEDILDPIRNFMNGPQRDLYDNARKFSQNQEGNFPYVAGEESVQLQTILADLKCYKGGQAQRLKSLVESLGQKVFIQLQEAKEKATQTVTARKQLLIGQEIFCKLSTEQQLQLTQEFDRFLLGVENYKLIAVVRDTTRRFDEEDYPQILDLMMVMAQPDPEPSAYVDSSSGEKPTVMETQFESIDARSILVMFDKVWIDNEQEVDRYLEKLKQAIMKEISEGKRIRI